MRKLVILFVLEGSEFLSSYIEIQERESCFYEEFCKIVNTANIISVFQPIISLKDAKILGYEALSRGPKDSFMKNPEILINFAKQYNKLWELEELFRLKALEAIHNKGLDVKIFLNIDPKIIGSMKFKDSFTNEYLKKYNLKSENIIFEVTEKEKVVDRVEFRRYIEERKYENYRIAIDDFGMGYSGLGRVYDMKPDYIKIDMDIIRNINEDFTKQAIVKSLCEYSKLAGCSLIAEGIETKEELKILIEMGVQYGQGYFIQKPDEYIKPIESYIVDTIRKINMPKSNEYNYNISRFNLNSITESLEAIEVDMLVCDVDSMFKKKQEILGVSVVDNEVVKGVVTRNSFYSKLGWQYGYSLYWNKPVSDIMNRDFLSIDYKTPIDIAIKLAMGRSEEVLYDHITVTKESKYYGIVTVKDLIDKTIEMEVNTARNLNPLTGLPGNIIIEDKIQKCILSREKYAVLYFDLDNFKPYNDVYGFESGDKVLKSLANIITRNIPENEFVGHIGGDDFIAILNSWDIEDLCKDMIKEFDEFAKDCYDEEDKKNGHIITHNRHGVEEMFPFISLSIAGLTNKNKQFINVYAVAKEASKIKKKCKEYIESQYIIS